jgi:hypothetical protein
MAVFFKKRWTSFDRQGRFPVVQFPEIDRAPAVRFGGSLVRVADNFKVIWLAEPEVDE